MNITSHVHTHHSPTCQKDWGDDEKRVILRANGQGKNSEDLMIDLPGRTAAAISRMAGIMGVRLKRVVS